MDATHAHPVSAAAQMIMKIVLLVGFHTAVHLTTAAAAAENAPTFLLSVKHRRRLAFVYPSSTSPVNMSQVNAFVVPGGKVVVFTGLLRQMDDEDQLATVLAHEVGHVLGRHVVSAAEVSQHSKLGCSHFSVARGMQQAYPGFARAVGLAGSIRFKTAQAKSTCSLGSATC